MLPNVLNELLARGAGEFNQAWTDKVPLLLIRIAIQSIMLGLPEMEQFAGAQCNQRERPE